MTSRMAWPEFAQLVGGLFSADTRLRRHFFPPKRDDDDPDKEG